MTSQRGPGARAYAVHANDAASPGARSAPVAPRAAGRGDYELAFRRFEMGVLGVIVLLALAGAVAGWCYGLVSQPAAPSAWTLAGAGLIAGGAVLPALLWSLMLLAGLVEATLGLLGELARAVPRLVLACGSVYAVYHFYQTLI